MAGMSRVFNCTRLSGAIFEQYKLITGKNLGRSTGHVHSHVWGKTPLQRLVDGQEEVMMELARKSACPWRAVI